MTATELCLDCGGPLMAGSQEDGRVDPLAQTWPGREGPLQAGTAIPERFAGCLASLAYAARKE